MLLQRMATKAEKLVKKGRTLARKGKFERAMAALRDACEHGRYDPDVWVARAEVAEQAEDLDEQTESLFHATDLYARGGLLNEARDLAARVLELKPQHGGARRLLKTIELKLGIESAPESSDSEGDASDDVEPEPSDADLEDAEDAVELTEAGTTPPPATRARREAKKARGKAKSKRGRKRRQVRESQRVAAVDAEAEPTDAETAEPPPEPPAAAPDPAAASPESGKEPGADRAAEPAAELARGRTEEPASADSPVVIEAVPADEADSLSGPAVDAEAAAGDGQPAAAAEAAPDGEAEAQRDTDSQALAEKAEDPAHGSAEASDENAENAENGAPVNGHKNGVTPGNGVAASVNGAAAGIEFEAETASQVDAAAADGAGDGVGARASEWSVARGSGELAIPGLELARSLSAKPTNGESDAPAHDIDIDAEPGTLVQAVAATVDASPLLSDLDNELVQELIDCGRVLFCDAGQAVFEQGESGTSLYLVLRGRVSVEMTEADGGVRELARLRPGAFFGEMALLTNGPRSATVRALMPSNLLEVSRESVRTLIQKDERILRQLMRFFRARLVGNLLATSPLFLPLERNEKRALIKQFRLRELSAGHLVVREGSPSEGLFLVLVGELQVFTGGAVSDPQVLGELGPGDVFGEMSLLDGADAMANIRTRGRSWVLLLPREKFGELVERFPHVGAQLASLVEERRVANARVFAQGRAPAPSVTVKPV